MRYCDVIVDITAEKLDRLFSYEIPPDMTLSVGQRVLVPFGPRQIEGYVMGFRSETQHDLSKIKRIIRPLEDYAAILPEMIELAEWMRSEYHCTLPEALRQMIPPQLRRERVREKKVRMAKLIIEGNAVDREVEAKSRAPVQQRIINELRNGPLPTAIIGDSAAINRLEQQGVLEIYEQETMRKPYKTIDERRVGDPELMDAQRYAVDEITCAMDAGGGKFLLNGVTGSGKTEVYIGAIRYALSLGKTAIVLVPEISLTPQMIDWFRARFGADAAVLHSRLSAGERYDEWRRIRFGSARVTIGARSAVFAPCQELGIIIVDEEHENTYKSDRRPCYDAREVAAFRQMQSGAVLVLGSATPSIATFMKATSPVRPENKLTLLELNERVMGRSLPEVELVDMRRELALGNNSMFSESLLQHMRECLDEGHQALLFLNRRGHSTFVSCRACGHVERCENCDVAMTYHQYGNLLKCHYCDNVRRPPVTCPQCGSKFIKYFGVGTQKVEDEVKKLFPDVSAARMDMDTTRGKDAHERILSEFRRGDTRILIGTQMITKGLDFPNVTLVGVISADMTLNVPDYRSVERTFQLITQVAGRAGRAESPGYVVVQTYDPDHFALKLAAKQDYRAFYRQEVVNRRRGLYPPYTVIARLLCASASLEAVSETAGALEDELRAFLDERGLGQDVVQMRAREAPLKKINNESRYMVYIKMYARGDTNSILRFMEQQAEREHGEVKVELEINPTNFL